MVPVLRKIDLPNRSIIVHYQSEIYNNIISYTIVYFFSLQLICQLRLTAMHDNDLLNAL